MKTPTILVVDDELFFRRLYSDILSENGYRVEALDSGEKALTRLHEGGVDILLTDLVMPGLGGLELLRQARLIDNPPDVILATGHATLDTAILALKNGARDYLIKPFQPDELRHLVHTCIEQRRLLDENTLLKSQIRLFQRGQNLASMLEIERLLSQAVGILLQELGGGRGFAFLCTEEQITRVVALEGLSASAAEDLAGVLYSQFETLEGGAIQRDGIVADPASPHRHLSTICLFPLRVNKDLRGGIVLFNPERRDIAVEPPMENLLFLAEQAALGFDNAFLYENAKELIHTDDLTGLYNHRYLHTILGHEIRRTQRYNLSFALVFIDIDHFKLVNDTHGHLAGSTALKEIATLLRESVREVDLLFRYGGDEFTALLVETESAGAAVVSERIREAIEEHVFLKESGLDIKLTATVGFAIFPEDARTKQDIIDLADKAMYEGKKVRNVSRGARQICGQQGTGRERSQQGREDDMNLLHRKEADLI